MLKEGDARLVEVRVAPTTPTGLRRLVDQIEAACTMHADAMTPESRVELVRSLSGLADAVLADRTWLDVLEAMERLGKVRHRPARTWPEREEQGREQRRAEQEVFKLADALAGHPWTDFEPNGGQDVG